MRRRVDDGLDPERAAHRDLLELPSVLHRKAEAGRLGRPYRPIPATLREKGEEVTRSVILTSTLSEAKGRRKDLFLGDASPSARLSMTRRIRSAWLGSAKLIIGTFNAVTNGLTSSMPAPAADRNVDMPIGRQAGLEGVMMRSLT